MSLGFPHNRALHGKCMYAITAGAHRRSATKLTKWYHATLPSLEAWQVQVCYRIQYQHWSRMLEGLIPKAVRIRPIACFKPLQLGVKLGRSRNGCYLGIRHSIQPYTAGLVPPVTKPRAHAPACILDRKMSRAQQKRLLFSSKLASDQAAGLGASHCLPSRTA